MIMPSTVHHDDTTVLKQAAREGHLPAIEELAKRSIHRIGGKFNNLIPYIEKVLPGVPPNPDGNLECAALTVIQSITHGLETDMLPTPPHLTNKIYSAMYPWIVHFLCKYPLDSDIPISDNFVQTDVIRLARNLVKLPDRVIEVSNYPKLMGTIAKFALVATSVTSDSSLLRDASYIIRKVMASVDSRKTPNVRWSSEVYDALHDNTPPLVAQNTVQRMIELSQAREISHLDLISRLEMMLLCSGNAPALRLSFLSKKSVSWTAYVTSRLVRRGITPSVDSRRSMELCALYLKKNLKGGFTWVSDALDKHIIESIIKAQPYLSSESSVAATLESLFVDIFGTITLMTVYQSVLRRANRCVIHASKMEEVKTLRGPLLDAWKRLKETTESRWGFRPMYRIARGRTCAVDGCRPVVGSGERDHRCSGCQYAYYCSVEHAKRGWREGHRKQCLELQRQFAVGYPRTMSPTEDQWFIALAQAELYKDSVRPRGRAMRAAYMKSHPRVPRPEVLLWVNFTTLETTLSVMSVDEFVSVRNMGYFNVELMKSMVAGTDKFLAGVTVPQREMEEYHCLAVSTI